MLKVGDTVRVKDSITLWEKYWIVECLEEHTETKGMEWKIEQVFGNGVGYILSISPGVTFDESMFELVSTSEANDRKNMMEQPKQNVVVTSIKPQSKRQCVHERLEKYQKMIDKLEEVDRDMFFWMLYDKLESILYEEYGQ